MGLFWQVPRENWSGAGWVPKVHGGRSSLGVPWVRFPRRVLPCLADNTNRCFSWPDKSFNSSHIWMCNCFHEKSSSMNLQACTQRATGLLATSSMTERSASLQITCKLSFYKSSLSSCKSSISILSSCGSMLSKVNSSSNYDYPPSNHHHHHNSHQGDFVLKSPQLSLIEEITTWWHGKEHAACLYFQQLFFLI